MSEHPTIDLDVKEAAECGLFSIPQLLSRKSGPELARFDARVAALAGRDTMDLRASVGTCTDPAMLWALHAELMGRAVPPILRGPRPWHLGAQGRLVEFGADLVWLAVMDPGHRARHGLARGILRTERGSGGWWQLVVRQFGRSGDVRGLVLALGLTEPQRRHLRTLQTSPRARLFERLHGDGFGRLVEAIEDALRAAPDRSGRTAPRATAIRRAQLWRVHRLLGQGPAGTAYSWARLSGEKLERWQVARQLAAVEPVALAHERARVEVDDASSL
ncbi:MAG: hypothetical protein A2Z90_15485 [Burkholderiales bacterium GWA2_64_37]|nr:MAG: hypothetical protein A2Z90_15485 [Burkholderiales bacterium GWA2_64_37]HCE92402.1 hypothetical protein [Acidovorax sp.]